MRGVSPSLGASDGAGKRERRGDWVAGENSEEGSREGRSNGSIPQQVCGVMGHDEWLDLLFM